MDFGPEGLAETMGRLQSAGILHVGAGADRGSAEAPVILSRNGQRVGVLAWCKVEQASPLYAGSQSAGVATFHVETCLRQVREFRPQVDWLIVSLHWGHEMSTLPSPEQRDQARRLIEAGVDVILGHHPHVVQPMESIEGRPVFYSLGNFLFSGMFWRGTDGSGQPFVARHRIHPLSRRTAWVEVELVKGEPARTNFHPVRLTPALDIVPEESRARTRDWERINQQMLAEDYTSAYASELRLAAERTRWRYAWRSLPRLIELKLFQHGLLPFTVEAT
jgi:hypothetical protein